MIRFYDSESTMAFINPLMAAVFRTVLGDEGPQAPADQVLRDMKQDESEMASRGYRVASSQLVDFGFHRVYKVTYELREAP